MGFRPMPRCLSLAARLVTTVVAFTTGMVPHTVVARSAPAARRVGWWVVLLFLAFLALASIVAALVIFFKRRNMTEEDLEERQRLSRAFVAAALVAVVSSTGLALWLKRASLPQGVVPAPQGSVLSLGSSTSTLLTQSFPSDGGQDVARNASLYLWFSKPLTRSSVIDDRGTTEEHDDGAQGNTVRLYRADALNAQGEPIEAVALRARSNAAVTIIALDPQTLLGSPTAPTRYILELRNIRTAQGGTALGGSNGKNISFTVSIMMDQTPPELRGRFPIGSTPLAPNSALAWSFSEPVDPVSAEGALVVTRGTNSIAHTTHLSVDSTIVEILPTSLCAQNQCREPMSCWPLSSSVSVRLTTPSRGSYPPRGFRDWYGNTAAFGRLPAQESIAFTAVIDRTSPAIRTVYPRPNASGVDPSVPITVEFTQPMLSSSLTPSSIVLRGDGQYSLRVSNDPQKGVTTATIDHERFNADALITPMVTSEARALNQQCFLPCTGP